MDRVIISRDCCDMVSDGKGGLKPLYDHRVFVVGPLWSEGQHASEYIEASYSSTPTREKASRFDREVAESLLASGKWKHLEPEIEAAP